MNKATGFIKAGTLGITVWIMGCAVGPDFHRPPPPNVKGYTPEPLVPQTAFADTVGGQAQKFKVGQDIPGQWWTLFHSESLNRLVNDALKANPSLQAAQGALRQARETVYATEGELLPSVDAQATVNREQTSGAEFGLPNTPGSLFTLYNASVSVSYGFDVFGVARRTLESVGAQADLERFQLEAAYLTLTANVVTTAIQEAALRAQVAATRKIVETDSQELNVLQRQFNAGGTTQTNVLAQQVTLAQAKATLPSLLKQLAVAHDQLAALTGRFPNAVFGEDFDLVTLQLPSELPVSLPSKLVEQRPDILAAESQLHAASAQVGLATAKLLPQVTITGNFGSDAVTAGSLFSSGTWIWNLGANLLQPVFHGGTLVHQRRAAIAAYDTAAAQYRSAVLVAFQNVADVLRALQSDADTLQAQAQAAQSASSGLDIARKQYEAGAITYLSLLNAEQTYQQTQISLIQAEASRYADTAALFQALGGGWWHRTDAADAAR